jgi:hypothetical protein
MQRRNQEWLEGQIEYQPAEKNFHGWLTLKLGK